MEHSNAMTPAAALRTLPTRIPHLRGCSLATQWLASPGGLPTAAKAGKRAAADAVRALIPSPAIRRLIPLHAE